ncbi:shikimate dehydrogenase [Woodsholea maritima]|uniref:shikimate dehydrogenase n=1 Tax=Woodsholea maritima TaxID=240237 RepID=UPI0003679B46|nr:shikimate dehydrogenase [Woodsholea maritima]
MALPMPLAGVVGWPVAHSLSPVMMDQWLAATQCDGRYCAFAVKPEDFSRVIKTLPDMGVVGVNVTLPHKEAALKIADILSDRAKAVGAVNVLTFKDGHIHGDNSDVIGIETALEPVTHRDLPVLVLGAGGAARAALTALKSLGFSNIRLTNRTRERAEDLAQMLSPSAQIYEWQDKRAVEACGLIINATSMGLKGQNPLHLDLKGVDARASVFDMVYNPLKTQLLDDAEAVGLTTIDGLEMLIGQARPAFEAFFGVKPVEPSDQSVRETLVSALGL